MNFLVTKSVQQIKVDTQNTEKYTENHTNVNKGGYMILFLGQNKSKPKRTVDTKKEMSSHFICHVL